ncbi:hypothetical protein PAAG_03912 [Paracoccidioides lutzii Pb01]|uniref:Uncharacterized protein n=1 Tax=Paracoccidioides lutzii (strain ATCC MYA-826 / Pb01) TaxID=502779 RepID=C1GZG8_PARBA|nr:hypothetical protein PAAG_03912 [Paracoccidioides lutzii Pb01]EEH41991.2 hypothetical protein PAAG_03912 [Paracoccidioides lutzii Pb01]
MPRILPWQVNIKGRKSTTSTRSASRKPSPSQASTETELANAPTSTRTPRHTVQTPPSPPCEPPPVELMKEGLESDNQYIMVEDEFLATAQTFTRHLHHAEYVRRKKEAKIKNANALKDLARSAGLKGTLSADIRKNMESEENAAQHNAALEEFKRVAGRPPVDSEVEDGVGSEEDSDDDPWVGTSLQNLMNQKKHQSLVGLQGIRSASRAALGFSKTPARSPWERPKSDEYVKDPVSNRGTEVNPHLIDDETSTCDDDDLDAQSRRPESVQMATQQSKCTGESTNSVPISLSIIEGAQTVSRSNVQEKVTASHHLVRPNTEHPRYNPIPPSTRKSKVMTLLDEFDDDKVHVIRKYDMKAKDQTRKRVPSETASNKRHKRDRNSKESHLSEVPTFLL